MHPNFPADEGEVKYHQVANGTAPRLTAAAFANAFAEPITLNLSTRSSPDLRAKQTPWKRAREAIDSFMPVLLHATRRSPGRHRYGDTQPCELKATALAQIPSSSTIRSLTLSGAGARRFIRRTWPA